MNGRPRRLALIPILCLCLLAALAAAGCGSSEPADTRPAPAAAEFPSAQGKSIDQILEGSGATPSEAVVAPAAQSFEVGVNRYPFGVFATDGAQIDAADVALYFAKNADAPVQGPLPAKVVSLETKPAYRAQGSDGDVSTAYVVPAVDFDRGGPWLAVAMLKGPDGLEATRLPSPTVGLYPEIPAVGERAPRVHTPTADEVGDLSEIDTRVPPDQMHAVDFADVVGRKPTVLLFATPALCTSRVCGPIVDIAQQVADRRDGEVEFVHMEVYEDNDPNKPIRPQLEAYGLRTEPWTFAIDADGIVRERIEGAYGVAELEEAVEKILPTGR